VTLFRFRQGCDGGDDEGDADEGPFFHEDVAEAFGDALAFSGGGSFGSEMGVERPQLLWFSAGDEGGGLGVRISSLISRYR